MYNFYHLILIFDFLAYFFSGRVSQKCSQIFIVINVWRTSNHRIKFIFRDNDYSRSFVRRDRDDNFSSRKEKKDPRIRSKVISHSSKSFSPFFLLWFRKLNVRCPHTITITLTVGGLLVRQCTTRPWNIFYFLERPRPHPWHRHFSIILACATATVSRSTHPAYSSLR